jgi:hypothetical protein
MTHAGQAGGGNAAHVSQSENTDPRSHCGAWHFTCVDAGRLIKPARLAHEIDQQIKT